MCRRSVFAHDAQVEEHTLRSLALTVHVPLDAAKLQVEDDDKDRDEDRTSDGTLEARAASFLLSRAMKRSSSWLLDDHEPSASEFIVMLSLRRSSSEPALASSALRRASLQQRSLGSFTCASVQALDAQQPREQCQGCGSAIGRVCSASCNDRNFLSSRILTSTAHRHFLLALTLLSLFIPPAALMCFGCVCLCVFVSSPGVRVSSSIFGSCYCLYYVLRAKEVHGVNPCLDSNFKVHF